MSQSAAPRPVLVVDNFDSFVYNLVQYLGQLGVRCIVRRNDAVTVDELPDLDVAGVLLSPGPGTPDQAGVTVPMVRAAAEAGIPVLGVCLGHQAIAEAFGLTFDIRERNEVALPEYDGPLDLEYASAG